MNSSARRALPILLAATAASRLPFLLSGYGSDPDAWRVAYVARSLWETGSYQVSRFPGYPVHEILSAPLVALGGSAASNAATLAAFLLSVAVFHSWLRLTRASAPLLLTAAYAFTPLLWVASGTTLDYAWSLLFFVLSMRAASEGKAVWAGAAAGLMAGCRPSNVLLFAVPLLLLAGSGAPGRPRLRFLAAAAVTGALAFTPVIASYGAPAWLAACMHQAELVAEPLPRRLLLAGYRSVYAIGPFAAAAFVLLLGARRRELARLLADGDPVTRAAVTGLIVAAASFVALPAERAYLAPVLPLLLALADRIGTRGWVVALVTVLLLHGAVNFDVVRHEAGGGSPGFTVRPGLVAEELHKRGEIGRKRRFLGTADLPDSLVVLVGSGPQLWVENPPFAFDRDPFWLRFGDRTVEDFADRPVHRVDRPSVHFLPLLSRDEALLVKGAGLSIAVTEDVAAYVRRVAGPAFDSLDVTVLPLPLR